LGDGGKSARLPSNAAKRQKHRQHFMNISASPAHTNPQPPHFRYLDHPVLTPQAGVPWADSMVLNPAIIDDPRSNRIHMIFRTSGPWTWMDAGGQSLPYPYFLGYACSDDEGVTWQADFSRYCLGPALEKEPGKIRILARDGSQKINYANGGIEDPRLFRLDGKVYLTTANRMFPPGAYWVHDEPMQCAPAWARNGGANPAGLGRAASENLTVSTLWEVDLDALARRDYEKAFAYVTHLTDPERGDNRDVFLFPEKLVIDGRPQYACLHRPPRPETFGAEFRGLPPSILLATAGCLEDLPTDRARHRLLARPQFEWEGDRIGASWAPLPLGGGEWLLPCHGKQDAKVGYTQSFMILRPGADGCPVVVHRCPARLMYAQQPWELAGRFPTPCLFTCGGLVRKSGDLLMTYGAADTKTGVAWVNCEQLVAYVRKFDKDGK
jgi:predicted GH43/DUF377 family glycosyl hydrolase